jgi:hypothetical protein
VFRIWIRIDFALLDLDTFLESGFGPGAKKLIKILTNEPDFQPYKMAFVPRYVFLSVFRIRIHMFLGLPDPDPLVRGMDPDPSIIKKK